MGYSPDAEPHRPSRFFCGTRTHARAQSTGIQSWYPILSFLLVLANECVVCLLPLDLRAGVRPAPQRPILSACRFEFSVSPPSLSASIVRCLRLLRFPPNYWFSAYTPTLLRADSHIGGQVPDCLHFCVPGLEKSVIFLPFVTLLELNLVSGDEVRRVTDVAFPTSGTRLHGCQRYSVQGCTLGVASLASSSKQVHSFSSHVSSLSRSSMVSAFRTLVLISLVGAGILHRRHPSVSPTPNTVTQRCVSFLLCAPQCCAV